MKKPEIELNNALVKDKFLKDINNLVLDHNLSYMDALVHYCETNNIEIEAAAQIIKKNPKLKSELQSEAEDLHFLPKTSKLPL